MWLRNGGNGRSSIFPKHVARLQRVDRKPFCAASTADSHRNCEYGHAFSTHCDQIWRRGLMRCQDDASGVGFAHRSRKDGIAPIGTGRCSVKKLLAMRRTIATAVFAISMLPPRDRTRSISVWIPTHVLAEANTLRTNTSTTTGRGKSETSKSARAGALPKGPLQIIISIADQRVSLF